MQSGKHVDEITPNAVLAWCPIHNTITYADGYVTQSDADSLKKQIAAGAKNVRPRR